MKNHNCAIIKEIKYTWKRPLRKSDYQTVLFLVHSTLLKIILSHLDFFISATASFPRDSHFPRWNRDSVSLPERIIWQQCTNPVAPAYIQFPTSAIFSPSVEHKLSINSHQAFLSCAISCNPLHVPLRLFICLQFSSV